MICRSTFRSTSRSTSRSTCRCIDMQIYWACRPCTCVSAQSRVHAAAAVKRICLHNSSVLSPYSTHVSLQSHEHAASAVKGMCLHSSSISHSTLTSHALPTVVCACTTAQRQTAPSPVMYSHAILRPASHILKVFGNVPIVSLKNLCNSLTSHALPTGTCASQACQWIRLAFRAVWLVLFTDTGPSSRRARTTRPTGVLVC
jgi:hypothetical protein